MAVILLFFKNLTVTALDKCVSMGKVSVQCYWVEYNICLFYLLWLLIAVYIQYRSDFIQAADILVQFYYYYHHNYIGL
jgi:hypothetical protein